MERYNHEIKKKIEELIDKNMENDLKNVMSDRLPAIAERNRHIKSERGHEESELYIGNPSKSNNSSSLSHKNPQIAYLDYLKMKKQQRAV